MNKLTQQTSLRMDGANLDGLIDGLDVAQRSIVNQGLDIQAEFNTMCAFEYLKAHDIDADVIERVLLLKPERREKQIPPVLHQ